MDGRSVVRVTPRADGSTGPEESRAVEAKVEESACVHQTSIFWHPRIIAEYAQLFINLALVCFVVYIFVSVFYMLQRDVQSRIEQIVRTEVNKVEMCEKNYVQNQCDPAVRVPALEDLCTEWFQCINNGKVATLRSHYTFRSAKLWAQTIADIINAFVDEIKIKAFVFLLVTIVLAITVMNAMFSNLISSYSIQSTQKTVT